MASPTTRDEWREYCMYEPTPDSQRPRLSIDEIKALSPADREIYNERRIDYLNEERVFPTRDLKRILKHSRRLLRRSRVEKWVARPGIRVSGKPRTGKTTDVMAAGKRLDAELRRASGKGNDRSYLPVVYTTIATATTTNKLWVRLADFVGVRELRGSNADERLVDLARLLKGLGTKFVILDDVQRLNTDRAAGAEVADNIKTFAENLDATMLFAGISLETAPLFSGENGEQWRKRTRAVNLAKYELSNEADHLEWIELVASLERILPLPLHEEGLLESNADYLYHRTDGSIAALTDLIIDAATDAIDLGMEAITLKLLDSVAVDDVDLEAADVD
ncbi:TniB family NTP-binding protein [Mycobacteroides abscessus]|uniref:TniB family NTP-binding protein n=1 Tax=Mycobacteroides abscessus TaxID=36809 RepID=UPI001300151C|nr:TniB family NTP-binding protein [Mycobacteroides abscessus]